MKAVILAGGFGTRLRPLSCTRPKILFPIGNKPLLDWTLKKLANSGAKKVVLAVNYMAEVFAQRYGKSKYGMRILYSRDPYPTPKTSALFQGPLRTGGPIKRAEKLIGANEPFLVLNGDIFTNINYAKVMKAHVKNNATATIALYRVTDPSRYGVAELTENNRIVRFVEKPSTEKAPSNLANAGIYALNPEIFDYIPSGQPVSLEREIFPTLAKEGKLYGYNFEGLWIDIGEPEDYLKANKLLLDLEMKKCRSKKVSRMMGEAQIIEPIIFGREVLVNEKSKIGPYVALGQRVFIGKGVHVENSIIFPRTIIADFSSIEGAIIGEYVIIGKHVKIEEGCIIGDRATIRDNVTLTRGVLVCPFKEVSESALTPKCLM